ncbi:MAG: cation transporter [Candidatus Pacebacteria bacterium]|nr:cation transporter [Candidatus Paceibacterota bacterium]
MASHFEDCIFEIDERCLCDFKRYRRILLVTILIFALEIVGGFATGSLSLLSDSFHVLSDVGASVVAIIVAYLAYKRAEHREEIQNLGAAIQGLLLIFSAGWILYEAIDRLGKEQEILSGAMILVTITGGLGNYIQHKMLSGSEDSITRRAMMWHILSDLWQSVAVLATGCVISLTQNNRIDTVASICIACVMIFGGCVMMRQGKNHNHHH